LPAQSVVTMVSTRDSVLALVLASIARINAQTCTTTFANIGCFIGDAFTATSAGIGLPIADAGFTVDEMAGITGTFPTLDAFTLEECATACGATPYIAVMPGRFSLKAQQVCITHIHY